MKFGCHISIRNGYYGAAQTALKIGAEAFQYFPKNPRSLKIKQYDRRDAQKCAAFCRKHDIVSIAHAPYPTNLSVPKPELRQPIIESILNDLAIVEDCGSIGLVVHFGSYKNGEPLEGYKRMIDVLNTVLEEWKGNSLVLIENTAGKGSELGTTMEELIKIRQLASHPVKIGFCLDTCHAFASGVWSGDNWNEVMNKGKKIGYFDHLKAIHLNNSMFETGSRRDRHANIPSGEIEVDQMKEFLTSSVVKNLPMILETPASESFTHGNEIAYVKRLVK
ncbi:MAG TPA: deoxyribonuclease IV [Bacillales bacterium]|nr:deoxyribonuclease IV [Bacillales bacterium]